MTDITILYKSQQKQHIQKIIIQFWAIVAVGGPRCPNIKPTLPQCVVFADILSYIAYSQVEYRKK